MQVTVTLIVLALAHDTDRIVSIYVATPKVAKASTIACCCHWRQRQHYHVTFANVNTA
jgi:hypothetical protein